MAERRRDNEFTEKAVKVQLVPVNFSKGEAAPETKQEKKLRAWLKLYHSATFRWKNRTCTIQVIYLLIFGLQVVKLSLLTWQMFEHGDDRAMFDSVVNKGQLTLKHLLLENWNANRETPPYPPSRGDFAVYTIDSLESGINYAVSGYYNAEIDSIGVYKRIDTDNMKATMEYFGFPGFQDAEDDKGITISEKQFTINHGLTNETKDDEIKYSYSIAKELQYLNISHPMKRMLTTTLEFTIHSVRPHKETRRGICLRIKGKVIFSDIEDNGQVVVKLDTVTSKISCGVMNLSIDDLFLMQNITNVLDEFVFFFCICSLIWTVLTVIFGSLLQSRFYKHFGGGKTKCKRFFYHIFWEILQFSSDCCTIIGISKIYRDTQDSELELSHLDTHAIWLGIGCFLTWFGFLRYFRVHNEFHLLFRTVSRAIPDVIAYMLCVTVLFVGFWICGYLVFGPYHIKFQTPDAAALTLFAIANGDEIYATLAMFDEDQTGSKNMVRFAHLYIGLFVSIYALIVVNLCIALFMTAYEEIKAKRKKSSINPMERAFEAFKKEQNVKTRQVALYQILKSSDEKSGAEQSLEKELGQIEGIRNVETRRPNNLKSFSFPCVEEEIYFHFLFGPKSCE